MFNQFHFDVLPIHPSLEPYESLTSYCTRIGQANLIKSVNGIAFTLFPESFARLIQNLSDLPPISVSTMAKATNQTEERIFESTFYYLGKNFERSTHPQPLGRFLSGAVAQSLRFCPICVSEKHYYSLLWRFNHITGCEEHGCKLLDCCPNCGNKLPLLHSPLIISRCPTCGKNSANGCVELLSEEDLISNKSQIEDIKLFLSPFTHPSKFAIPTLLKLARLYTNLRISDMTKIIGESEDSICNFEHMKVRMKFSSCVAYIKALGLSFKEILELPFINQIKNNSIIIPINNSKKQRKTING